jgi:prevent-host-death family protein
MSTTSVTLAEAKARLSELTERAAAGEEVIITKRGRPVGRLSRVARPRQPIDLAQLRQLTDGMSEASDAAATALERLRETARY